MKVALQLECGDNLFDAVANLAAGRPHKGIALPSAFVRSALDGFRVALHPKARGEDRLYARFSCPITFLIGHE